MSPCCRSGVCEELFNPRFARRTLRRYRRKGLDKIERGMLASVPAADLNDAGVLEVGGGIGTVQAELIKAGASRGEIIELVSAYEPYARELARDAGIDDRITFRVADILEHPEQASPADIVVLNRVVCCSPDGVRLAAMAAGLSRRTLLLSHPRDRVLVRIGMRVMNRVFWMLGRTFRVFLHPRAALYGAAEAEGFRLSKTGHTFAWEFAALRREPGAGRAFCQAELRVCRPDTPDRPSRIEPNSTYC
jgi:magnesium-protoporphyrin O-methyltransferase